MNKIALFAILGIVSIALVLAAAKADIGNNPGNNFADKMNIMHEQMRENFKDNPELLNRMDNMHEQMINQMKENPEGFHCPMMDNENLEGIQGMQDMHKAMHGSAISDISR